MKSSRTAIAPATGGTRAASARRFVWLLLFGFLFALAGAHQGRAASVDTDGATSIAPPALQAVQVPAAAADQVDPIAGAPAPIAKDRTNDSSDGIALSEHAVRTASARVSDRSARAPLATRKYALLFPFHFFW